MTTTLLPTGTLTLFISDVEGSTMLLQGLGDDYPDVLDRHNELIEAAIERHGGHEVSTHGDEVFAVFNSARGAVNAAVDAQRALSSESWPRGAELRVRIGLHTGQPRLHENDYVGLDVHRAARISAAGHGGQVLLSKETAEDLAESELPDAVHLRQIGWHRLKDLRYPELLYDLVVDDLASDFPPVSAMGQRPNNLQEAQTAFVGRSGDLTNLVQLIGEQRLKLVTLTGIGGAGKTRLAQAVGGRLLASFADGVFEVTLAAIREPKLVMPTVAQTLGVPEFPGLTVMDALKNRLAMSEMLLILDNFEHLLGAGREVAELLGSCPRLQVLVTSREALRVRGERVWPVPPLSFPEDDAEIRPEDLRGFDAVELFVERVRDFQPEFDVTPENAAAIRAITARLEGLPLALELAASRVSILSPEALLQRLDDRSEILSAERPDVDARHQTITRMIDWSYELLSTRDRTLFEELSVFSGGFTVDAAERICTPGQTDIDVIDGLQSLAAKSLLLSELVNGEPRLRMLAMIRHYARMKLESTQGAAPIRERHARHFAQFLAEIAPEFQGRDQKAAVVRLLDDANNFRSALEWSLSHPEAELTGQIMAALLWFWVPHGWFTEALDWADRAALIAEHHESAHERAVIHDVIGWIKLFSGDYAGALPHCQQSLELFETLGNPSDVARTKMTLGITGAVTGELEIGPALIMEALGMYQELGDALGTALAYTALGEGARAGGDVATAEECYQSALELVVDSGNVYWQGGLLNNLAHFRLHDGNWPAAFEMASEALQLGEEYGYPMVVNLAIAALGGVAVARGDARLAARLFGATDKLLSDLGAMFEPLDLAELERNTDAARTLLSQDDYAAAFGEGREWTLDEAMSQALAQA